MKGIRTGALAMAAVAALCVTGCGIQAGGIGEEGGASGDLKGLEASEGSQAQEAGGQADEKGSWVPAGTVSVIVPAGPGGNTDRSAQVFAQYASQITGQEFAVSNVSGSVGTVAANQVLAAAPDGQTLLYGHNLVNVANVAGVADYHFSAFALGPTFVKDPVQQLYVNGSSFQNLEEFIRAAKEAPGRLRACTEVGAYTYYELLAFEEAAGIELNLVDVGSNADKIAAMLSGQADLMPGAYVNTKEYLDSGQLLCIGIPSEERYEILEGIPTLNEQGVDLVYPDCDFSLYFPKGTKKEVIAYYEWLVQEILRDPAAQEDIKEMNMMPYYLSAEESGRHDEEIYQAIKEVAQGLEAK